VVALPETHTPKLYLEEQIVDYIPMSVFALISCNSKEKEKVVENALKLFEVIFSINQINPKVYSGEWGVLVIWPGPRDHLSSHISKPELWSSCLGWCPNTEVADWLYRALHDGHLRTEEIKPLKDAEESLGLFVHIKATKKSAAVIPDPYGLYPLYIAKLAKARVISNNPLLVLALEGINPEICKQALWERVITEGNLGDEALFMGVRRLEKCEWAYLSEEGINTRSYSLEKKEICATRLVELLQQSYLKITRSGRNVVLKLTGGMDSRLNLGVAVSLGERPLCYTKNSPDTLVASDLARKFGLQHLIVDANGKPLPISTSKHLVDTKEAVFITGGCGELARAFYVKGAFKKVNHLDAVIDAYLSPKRLAMLSVDKIDALRARLESRLKDLSISSEKTFLDPVDGIYVDRIRTWYAEAWTQPLGSNDCPLLLGPAIYNYARGFDINSRANSIPHSLLIEKLLGGDLPPYLKLKGNLVSRTLRYSPAYVQVFAYKLIYAYARISGSSSRNYTQQTSSLTKFFDSAEIQNLILCRPTILKKVQKVMEAVERLETLAPALRMEHRPL
jgi:hypothetical protein